MPIYENRKEEISKEDKKSNIVGVMNHGRCERCGWWKNIFGTKGICHISKAYNDEAKVTDNDDYCPDYINQKKFKFKPKNNT
jgi:hypothetical protein